MLVLSRKREESVVIGGSDGNHRLMKVTVLAIKGASVKLGFEVDDKVPVHRSEVWERINARDLEDRLANEFIERASETLGGGHFNE